MICSKGRAETKMPLSKSACRTVANLPKGRLWSLWPDDLFSPLDCQTFAECFPRHSTTNLKPGFQVAAFRKDAGTSALAWPQSPIKGFAVTHSGMTQHYGSQILSWPRQRHHTKTCMLEGSIQLQLIHQDTKKFPPYEKKRMSVKPLIVFFGKWATL